MSSLSIFFKRTNNVFNNILEETCRKRRALTFRKTLGVYNFKYKKAGYYKNPHAMSLRIKEQLKKTGTENSWRKIKAIERLSISPYGSTTSRGHFRLDPKRIPNYNIPDLTDFKLEPYVTFKTTKLEDDQKIKKDTNFEELFKTYIKGQLTASTDPKVRKLAKDIFETTRGKEITAEFFERYKRRNKTIRITNF